MYQIRCDSYILYDPRDDELILDDPRCKMEVNTVGEASFTIYSNHPYYSKLRKKRSIIEYLQDGEPIFRGRITGDTVDFDNVKAVDVEGVLAFFNDSVIRPFAFPADFANDADYIAAADGGNVVAFFLGWLIDQHNAQVQDFQKFKLGKVTVADPNNYVTRSDADYNKTWDILKSKLFDSALGGYLCIRYESDGNYIDYLADFETTNPQPIAFGENLLDLVNESDSDETYSAVLPQGVKLEDESTGTAIKRLTVAELPDGNVTEDIVKEGDILYSKSAVENYGFVCAPPPETVWEDVTEAENLQKKAADYLTEQAVKLLNTITIKAVDLHFSDDAIASFRIYRYVDVKSLPHNQQARYVLSQIDIDIENPQNTVFTLGDKTLTLTDMNSAASQIITEKVGGTNAVLEAQIIALDNKTTQKISQTESTVEELEERVIVLEKGQQTIETDETLSFTGGVLSVNRATDAEADNTLPITSAAVYVEIGNIDTLLKTI